MPVAHVFLGGGTASLWPMAIASNRVTVSAGFADATVLSACGDSSGGNYECWFIPLVLLFLLQKNDAISNILA